MNFVEAHQILKEFSGGEPENFLLCMSGDSQPLHIYLKAKAALKGYEIKLETLQFDTFQQYLNHNQNSKDGPIALLLPWDFCLELNWRTGMPSDLVDYSNLVERINLTKERIQACECKKIVYVPAPCPPVFHERRKNQLLSLYIHSVAIELSAEILDPECFSLEFFLQSGCPISGQQLDHVATHLYKSTESYQLNQKKILVTDADNTLWNGVLGEDGISNLKCGLEGTGFVHYIYQSYLVQLQRTGILLALVTKNEKKDLDKVFSSGIMLLREKDFVSVMASYFSKSTQIKLLSEKLNLPLESCGFKDDSEKEIEEVIQSISNIDKSATQSWKNKIVPEIWNTGVHNNELFGIPTYVDMFSFITYNKKAFEEGGIKEPPKNWDELREVAKKLTKPGRPGIAFPATTTVLDGTIWEGIAYSNGGRIFNENTKKVKLNDRGCVDALQLYVDLIKDGSTPDPGVMLENRFAPLANQFIGGNYAMVMLPSFSYVPWGFDKRDQFSDFLFPRPPKVTGSYDPVATLMDPTACLMVNSRSKNYEEIMAYLKFWTNDDQLKFWGTKEMARIPASKNAWKSNEMRDLWPNRVNAYNDGSLFNGSTPAPRFIGVSQIEQYMRTAIQKAVGGKMSASDALNEANDNAQEQIDVLLGG